MPRSAVDLRYVRTFAQLVAYRRDELDWPIDKEPYQKLGPPCA